MDSSAKPFTFHNEFACHYSPVLKAAFNSGFLEGQTQEYRLDIQAIDENFVRLLEYWIYTQKLDLLQIRTQNGIAEPQFREEEKCLVKLWVLADKLLMPSLQNAIIDAIKNPSATGNNVPTHGIGYLNRKTPKDCALRGFFFALCTNLAPSSFTGNPTSFPSEFLLELVVFLRTKMSKELISTLHLRNDMSAFKVQEK